MQKECVISSKACLEFHKGHNSFTVKVLNLESLSVEQIQELQAFAVQRNGLFDFNTYSFTIQKRIEFEEFYRLIKHLNINAIITEALIIETTKPRIYFGQYKGMFYEDLDDSYLLWLHSNYRGSDKSKIEAEITKRQL